MNINKTRKPVVAGRFYPESKRVLTDELKSLAGISLNNTKERENPRAIVVPHAGYIFTGKIAGQAFSRIDFSDIENVFILTGSHALSFEGASIYMNGNYETPLGEINTNFDIARELMGHSHLFKYVPGAHDKEQF